MSRVPRILVASALLLVAVMALIVIVSQITTAGYTGPDETGVATRLVAVFDIPFLLALVAGVAAAVPMGLLFALPAVRTRGINLAIVTLGLGSTIELMLFQYAKSTG